MDIIHIHYSLIFVISVMWKVLKKKYFDNTDMIAYEVVSLNAPVQDTRYRYYSPALSVSPIFPIKLSTLHTGRYFLRINEDTL